MNPFGIIQLPADWQIKPISEVGDVRYGLGQPPELDDNGVAMIRATNIKKGGISPVGLIRIKRSAIPESRNAYLKTGDVLVVRSGAYTGDVAIVTEPWAGSVAGYDLVLSIRDKVDASFCAFALRSAEVQNYFKSQSARSAQPHLNRQQLDSTMVPIPPLPEQQKIAAVLGVVQRAMEQQERLLALTAELKKTLLHQLFTQGLRHEPQKQTDIGPVPESWEVLPLSECAIVQTGAAKGRNFKGNETIEAPYLRVANVQSGYLDLTEMKTITIQAKELSRYALHDGDIVLTEGGDFDKLGRGFIWRGQIKDCVHQNHVFAVRVDRKKLLPEFFAHQSQSQYGKAYFLSVAHKTTNLACINTTKLKAFPVLIPSMEEQREIVAALEGVDAKLSTVRRKHDTLTALFRTLLHQMMTAQIRVAHIDLPSLS